MLKFLTDAVEKNASDIFIIPGLSLSYKINGKIIPVDDNKLMPRRFGGSDHCAL